MADLPNGLRTPTPYTMFGPQDASSQNIEDRRGDTWINRGGHWLGGLGQSLLSNLSSQPYDDPFGIGPPQETYNMLRLLLRASDAR